MSAASDLAAIAAEVKELQEAKTRTPPDGLAHILTAPRDGSPFKARLVDDDEEVTVRFDEGHHHYMGFCRWYEMPVFRGRVALTIEALPKGYVVVQPQAQMGELSLTLCAATTLDECLSFVKDAIDNARPPA